MWQAVVGWVLDWAFNKLVSWLQTVHAAQKQQAGNQASADNSVAPLQQAKTTQEVADAVRGALNGF